jgi:aminoglycoside phosphotransferase (APT) family kinase protein
VEPPVWTADIGIDTALASRLIAGAFPQLAVQAVEPFGSGWDNAAFLADGRIVFRFPRRRAVANLIEREIALLPLLAPRLPLAISVPVYIGAASPAYPWAFAGYECITGTTACALSLDNRTRHSLALPLARFLHALHGIAADPLVAAGLPPDELGRLDPDKRLRLARERLPVLEAAGIDARGAVAWLAANPPQALAERERTVVHGDLYARHVLVDARRKPTGVIDWGDIHLGDPALDIAIAHMLLPANAHAAFRDAYGLIDERTWRAARYRALYHAILEIEYGIRENDAGMRDCGTATLRLADVLNRSYW